MYHSLSRRAFLGAASGSAFAATPAQNRPLPIIDTHIHMYDPTRPQGVSWPPKDSALYQRTILPAVYRALTKPLGIVGTVVVEASTWLEDNQWVLDVAEKDTIVVGFVGNLEPGKPDFSKHLDRFAKYPLFRGIRFGYLWGRSLAAELPKPEFVAGMKALAGAGLQLDAVGGPRVLPDVVRLTDKVPELRVVIDHLPFDSPTDPADQAAYKSALQELGKRPRVYAKVSSVLRRPDDRLRTDLTFYRSALDELWEIFGPDRVVYGSNWPVSDRLGTYPQVLQIVRDYFAGKGREAEEKYFWRNSIAAYRWVKRDASQPYARTLAWSA